MNSVDVSIVVCTHNRAGSLAGALESLAMLDARNFLYEIVVVDNASTDETPQVVLDAAQRYEVPIRHVKEERAGVAFARNRGIKEARGEWVAFFDDGQLADRRWLAELLATAENKSVRCVGGAVWLKLPENVNRSLAPICRELLGETVGQGALHKYNYRVTPGTGNLLLHCSLFDEVGRFDESLNLRGEDTDLFRRIHGQGNEAWYTSKAIVWHVIPTERLSDEYLMSVSRLNVPGMAANERDIWGRRLYPMVYAARMAQTVLLHLPRLAWACLVRNSERALGARCRLEMARCYLRDGLNLMLSKPEPQSNMMMKLGDSAVADVL